MNDLQLFMILYMYELELWLTNNKKELLQIPFQSDEANTDKPLKDYLKTAIELHCNHITQLKSIQSIIIDKKEYKVTSNIKNAMIKAVILPPIADELKSIIKKRKDAAFTQPDMCLAIEINGKIEYETVELKSTKTDAIPGSSVQQITPEEWVVFVKHTKNNFEIATGQYVYAINTKMEFPDRSPRPQVSFKELLNWNNNCRIISDKTIKYTTSDNGSDKYALITDWQDFLAKRWIRVVFGEDPHKGESWFNNNLRRFLLQFLERYDAMSEQEKSNYKELLTKSIK